MIVGNFNVSYYFILFFYIFLNLYCKNKKKRYNYSDKRVKKSLNIGSDSYEKNIIIFDYALNIEQHFNGSNIHDISKG